MNETLLSFSRDLDLMVNVCPVNALESYQTFGIYRHIRENHLRKLKIMQSS